LCLLRVLQKAQLLRAFEQHPHGRRLPAGASARGAFAHGFQPVTDRLERDVRVRALDASDNRGQAVVGFSSSSATKHFIGQKPVADIGLHSAQETALGSATRLGQGAVDDAHNVFPGQVGAQPAHLGHPVLSRLVQPLHVAVLPREPHLA